MTQENKSTGSFSPSHPIACLQLDSRRHERIPLRLTGNALLEDGREFPVKTVDVSASGVSFEADERPVVGDRVVVYLQAIGGFEGRVVRVTPTGFAVEFRATEQRRSKLSQQLTWLLEREIRGEGLLRLHERIVPLQKAYIASVVDETMPVEILDLSRAGVAVLASASPPVGATVTIGQTRGKIVRHTETGFAVEFLRPLPLETFSENLVL